MRLKNNLFKMMKYSLKVSLFSSAVERQPFKLVAAGSIPAGGFFGFPFYFFIHLLLSTSMDSPDKNINDKIR